MKETLIMKTNCKDMVTHHPTIQDGSFILSIQTKQNKTKNNLPTPKHCQIIGTILPWKNLKKSKFKILI
jgi:hypothetical protein